MKLFLDEFKTESLPQNIPLKQKLQLLRNKINNEKKKC